MNNIILSQKAGEKYLLRLVPITPIFNIIIIRRTFFRETHELLTLIIKTKWWLQLIWVHTSYDITFKLYQIRINYDITINNIFKCYTNNNNNH